MPSSVRRTVTFTAPGQVELREEHLPPPNDDEVRVQTIVSGISPGTERLVYRGKAPEALPADASFASMDGESLGFPLTYGYACVGRVEAVGGEVDSDWVGTRVFGFQPHTSGFTCRPEALVPVPDAVSEEEAVLIPSLETAVNFVLDGRPVIGESVVVFGQGVVGLLTTALLSDHPVADLFVVEPTADRRRWARKFGADQTFSSDGLSDIQAALCVTSQDAVEVSQTFEGADLTYELSGNPHALNDAIACTGFSGRVVIGSWYGTEEASLALGERFHRSRIEIRSSQVSTIAPQDRGRWSKARRMQVVLSLLSDRSFEQLITHAYPVADAARAYEELDTGDPEMIQPIFRYS